MKLAGLLLLVAGWGNRYIRRHPATVSDGARRIFALAGLAVEVAWTGSDSQLSSRSDTGKG